MGRKARKMSAALAAMAISLFAFTGYPTGSGWAADAKTEYYAGQVQKDGNVISVNLTLKNPPGPGKRDATLSYGGKRLCTCLGTYDGEASGKMVFSLQSQNGGSFCEKLDRLELTRTSAAVLYYAVTSSDGQIHEEGNLDKAN